MDVIDSEKGGYIQAKSKSMTLINFKNFLKENKFLDTIEFWILVMYLIAMAAVLISMLVSAYGF